MRWVEEWTKDQAWGCPRTPRNIQEVQASKLGDAPEAPLLHRQKWGHRSTHYIFIASCIMCFSWSVSCFSFQFSLVLFAAIKGWTPTNSFWRSSLAFHLPRTLRFSLLSFQRVFSFSRTMFSFRFSPWFMFRSCYTFVSRCIFASGPCWFSSKKSCLKSSNGVGKEKKLYAKKSGTRRSLCRLRPRLLHVVLDIFLIACLVVLL
jgi:hypothetical protein